MHTDTPSNTTAFLYFYLCTSRSLAQTIRNRDTHRGTHTALDRWRRELPMALHSIWMRSIKRLWPENVFFSRAQLAHYFHWLKDVSALFKMISAGPGRILWWPAVCSAWLVPLRKSLQSVPLNWRPTFSKTGLCFLLQIHAHPSQEATYSGWMQSDSNSSH
jgi:hypothetical protein